MTRQMHEEPCPRCGHVAAVSQLVFELWRGATFRCGECRNVWVSPLEPHELPVQPVAVKPEHFGPQERD